MRVLKQLPETDQVLGGILASPSNFMRRFPRQYQAKHRGNDNFARLHTRLPNSVYDG